MANIETKIFNGILNDIEVWAKISNNEIQFKSNLHCSLMKRSSNKIKISDLTNNQFVTFRNKWQDIISKGRSKT